MNTAKIVNSSSPEHVSLQMKPTPRWGARSSGQGRYPSTKRGIKSFNIGGIKSPQLGLGLAHQLLSHCPTTVTKPMVNRDKMTTHLMLDDLNQMQFRPKQQPRSAWLASVARSTQHFDYGLFPATEPISDPHKRLATSQVCGHFNHDSLHQRGVTFNADFPPDEQARENVYGCGHPNGTKLSLNPHLIRLNLLAHQGPQSEYGRKCATLSTFLNDFNRALC